MFNVFLVCFDFLNPGVSKLVFLTFVEAKCKIKTIKWKRKGKKNNPDNESNDNFHSEMTAKEVNYKIQFLVSAEQK